MSDERGVEREKPEEEGNNQQSLTDSLNLVRKLISNQYSIVHHTERYIFDLTKIASIVLGVISIVGIPQLLLFESEDILLDALVEGICGAMILYSIVCFAIIVMAIWSVGGINLRLRGTFNPSLWWYSEDALSKLNPRKPENEWLRIKPILLDIEKRITQIPNDDTLEDEISTLLMLYIRTETQLRVARRMRNGLVWGLFFALGGFSAGLLP